MPIPEQLNPGLYWNSYGFQCSNMALTKIVKPIKPKIGWTSLCWYY